MTERTPDRRPMFRRTLSTLAVACFAMAPLLVSGCGTVKGVGKDIQYASEKTAEALSGDK